MKFSTLYGRDSSNNLKLWEVSTNDNIITVRHGKLGGKIQVKETVCSSKNIGKANETTPAEQALLEAQAKWEKQLKRGYFDNKEDALGYKDLTPMKAQNHNDYAHKVVYPCLIQPKLNGLRLLVDSKGKAQSKSGEPYTLPPHIQKDIDYLMDNNLLGDGLDGEVFAGYQKQGGLSLQQIVSAFRKPNENTDLLQYHVYDTVGDNSTQLERIELLDELPQSLYSIVIVDTVTCPDESFADSCYEKWLEQGAEGMVYRNTKSLYEFGKRSYNLIKRKPRETSECYVVSCKEDKNGQGLLSVELENGIAFELLMRKDSDESINYRLYENACKLIGTFVEFEYEELSDSGVPTKAVGVGLREVDKLTWQPNE